MILKSILAKNDSKRQNDTPFRRDGWIGDVKKRSNGVSRARTDLWEAFSGDVYNMVWPVGFLRFGEGTLQPMALEASE